MLEASHQQRTTYVVKENYSYVQSDGKIAKPGEEVTISDRDFEINGWRLEKKAHLVMKDKPGPKAHVHKDTVPASVERLLGDIIPEGGEVE